MSFEISTSVACPSEIGIKTLEYFFHHKLYLTVNKLRPFSISERKATSMDIFTEDLPNGDISVPVSTDYSSYSGALNPYLSMEPKISLPSSQSMQYNIGTVGASSSTTGLPSMVDSQSYQMAGRKTTNVKSYAPTIKSEYPGLPMSTSLTVAPQLGNPYANSVAGMSVNSVAGMSVNYVPTSSTMASMSHLDLNPMANTPSSKQHARKKQKTSAAAGTPVSTVDQVPLQTEVISQAVDWVYDPNEPRYCLCNQVSYGEMVGCDNPNCRIEWFHYGCVGITDPPKGKWFCPNCTVLMSKKKRR
ncbi:inhibitor of growth 3-like [Paramuricea clavata]|uniref:Inhibitor of growth protein 3 n=1 Tax=Paramuricea clavata TaxID=317549 RepID=A0A6S7JMU5_PARCT|nr:inhibitor of growth 3-like [Paramuricea clavata]